MPSGWTILSPICRSTVSSGSSHTTSCLATDRQTTQLASVRETRSHGTHSGNSPRQRATYSFCIVPSANSDERFRAHSAVSGMIIKPEVNRSSLLIAGRISDTQQSLERLSTNERTVDLLITEVIFQDLDKAVAEIPSRCVDRLSCT